MATTEKLTAESRTPVRHKDHDRDAPKDTRQGVPGPANSAGLVASRTSSGAITTEPVVSPANSAGTTGTAREDPERSPDDRSSKSSTSFNTDPPTNPRKKEKTKAKPPATPQHQDEISAEDLASLEDNASRADADFRQEITRFWENWCRVHVNYKKYQLDIRMRKVNDQRSVISNVTSSVGTSATSTTQPADGTSTTSSSTGQPQTISSSFTISVTSPREMAACAAPLNTTELMPELKLTVEELDILEGPKKDEQTDHPDALQLAEESLAQRALTDQPPQPPANSAGAAGVNSSETANSAASAVGSAGKAVQVQFEPPSHIRCAASVQSKPPDASTFPPELADEQLTLSELAFLEDLDIRGAHLLLDEPTYARTLTDFRDEIMVFWDGWCQYTYAPMPWTEEWTRHKLDKFLFARYQRQWPEVVYRDIADHQDQSSALMFYNGYGPPANHHQYGCPHG